jgi:two-component system sensor histidine kinase KdpD
VTTLRRPNLRWIAATGAEVLATLAIATVLVMLIEVAFGVDDASALYLLAVIALAIRSGTWAAMAVAIGSFLTYNYLFIDPLYTFTVARPAELLTLFLLLVIGIVTARLAGLQRDRAREAAHREREATALFGISRLLATAPRSEAVLPAVLERVGREAQLRRAWIATGPTIDQERVVASWGGAADRPRAHFQLRRTPEERGAAWVLLRPPTRREGPRVAPEAESYFRVALAADNREFGSLWAVRPRESGECTTEESRLLAVTADQVAAALERERLAAEAAELEIARRSEELKSALLDSVSHDLRTPLSAIRAGAGSIADVQVAWDQNEARATAEAIDAEAERLDRLVSNLLDMSRIEGGALKPELEVMPVAELLSPVADRMRRTLGDRLSVDVASDLPPVRVDVVFVEQILTNLLENAARHAGPEASVRLAAARGDDGTLRVSVEDSGGGVPPDALPHLFDKFYRVPRRGEGSRRGTGLGMAVARGLTESMGGSITAGASPLGGLAVTLTQPVA